MNPAPWNLLFICTGNICRSPMAEGLARHYGQRRGIPVEVSSGSTLGLVDRPAHKHAIRVMSEIGMDISDHRSQPITEEMIEAADHVLVMEIQHAAKLRVRFPVADTKLMLLGTFGGTVEIADPLGGWRRKFRKSRDEIRDCVETFIDRLPQR